MRSLWRDGDRIREVELAPLGAGRYQVTVDGSQLEVTAEPLPGGRWRLASGGQVAVAEVTVAGERRFVRLGALDFLLERTSGAASRGRDRASGGGLEAPMPGVVTRVLVAEGDAVKKGQPLVTLEAMKMEHVIRAPAAGRVKRVNARPGEMVNGGVALVEMDAAG